MTLGQKTDFVQLIRVLGRIVWRAVRQVPDQRVEGQKADAVSEGAGKNSAVGREADLLDVPFAVVRLLEIVRQTFAVVVESGIGWDFSATSGKKTTLTTNV